HAGRRGSCPGSGGLPLRAPCPPRTSQPVHVVPGGSWGPRVARDRLRRATRAIRARRQVATLTPDGQAPLHVQCAPASVSSPSERVASADTRRGARIAGRPWRRIQRARPARGTPRAVPRRATARDGGHRGTGERRARRAWRAYRGTAEPPAHRADRPRGRSDPTDRPREGDAQPPPTPVRTAHARPVSQTPPGRLMSGALGPGALVWAGFDGERAPGALLDAVHDGRVGGILLFAFRKNIRSKEQVRAMLREVQEAARRGGLPPVPGAVDQEGGTVVRVAYRAVFPSAMAIAATGEVGYARSAARAVAEGLAADGIAVNHAPVCDVN